MALTKTPSELTAADITITTAAQPNITSLGTLTTLTIDDITINGSTISDGGDLTIDVAGDIILDADGGDVNFKDGGTLYGFMAKSNNDLYFGNAISDGDVLVRGNDGGSNITALTLDMSDAGTAIFNNKVGIGTSAPTHELTIGASGADAKRSFSIEGTNGSSEKSTFEIENDGENSVAKFNFNTGGSTGTTRLTIDSSGRVLIGKNSSDYSVAGIELRPSEVLITKAGVNPLSVRNNADGGLISLNSAGTSAGTIAGRTGGGTKYLSLETNTSDGSDDSQVALDAGSGGGSTSRGAFFSVYGNERTSFPGHIYGQTGSAGNFIFATGASATEAMRIDANGHVRFGSSGDGFDSAWGDGTYGNQEVAIDGGGGYGVLHLRGDGAGSVNTRFSMGAGDDKFYMAYDDVDGAHRLIVDGAGTLKVGRDAGGTTDYGIDLYGSGHLYLFVDGLGDSDGFRLYNGSGTNTAAIDCDGDYHDLSDKRYKKNITDASSVLSTISDIRVRSFIWKESGRKQSYGFVAQELNEVAPEAVSPAKDDEDVWSIKHAKMIPMLTKAIQELKAQIETLQSEVKALKEA